MNATEAQTATKLVTNLKNANYGDKILVRFCNETIRIIKNLKKEEASTTAPSREAAKHLRAKLAYNMEWFAEWARKRAV